MQTRNIEIALSDGRPSSLLVSSEDSSRLAVFFPGTGYGTDKPLFYYAGRVAEQHGCDVLKLSYGDIDWRRAIEVDKRILAGVVDRCISSLEKAASAGYTELFFISKSFGTVVAGEVEKQLRREARQVFLTPLEQTLPYMRRKRRIAIAGTKDRLCSRAMLEEMARKSGIKIYLFEDATHSLEVEGDVRRSVEILYETVGLMADFIGSSPSPT